MMSQVEKVKDQVAAYQYKCTCANPLAIKCLNNQDDWRYKVCNATRHYLFTRCRYPAFTGKFIRRHVDKQDTGADELQAYIENSSEIRRNKALIIVCVYLTYCFKNLFVPLETFRMFNYDDFESNVKLQVGATLTSNFDELTTTTTTATTTTTTTAKATATTAAAAEPTTATKINSNEIIKLVTCLATNCSHLAPISDHSSASNLESESSRLAKDISKLPMFKLCHPIINSWYSPVTALDSLGVLIVLCISFNAFLLGSWCTIQQLIFPAGNEMIMFIVAPKVTASIAWLRTRELLASVSLSYAHFCLNSKLRFFTQTEHEYLSYSARLASLESDCCRDGKNRARRKQKRLIGKNEVTRGGQELELGDPKCVLKPIRSDAELDFMTNECLPIIRTCWWRKTITNIFLSILAASVGEILLLTVFAFGYIRRAISAKEEQLASFASEMRRQNCQLWYAHEATQSNEQLDDTGRQLIDMSRMGLTWTTYSRIEGSLFNVMPALGVSMMFAYYWGVMSEIEIWLAELRTLLVASLVVSRVKLSQRDGGARGQQLCAPDQAALLLPGTISLPSAGQISMRARTCTNASVSSRESCRTSSASNTSGSIIIKNSIGNLNRRSPLTNRIKTKHFFNMTYLRQQFQQEMGCIAMAYFTRMKPCYIRAHDGAVVHANETKLFDSNDKSVFKIREIKFMELIDGPLREEQKLRQFRRSNYLAATNNGRLVYTSGVDLNSDFKLTQLINDTGEIIANDEDGDGQDDFAHDIYTMEQVYVNFRLFIEHVHGLAPSMGVVLAMTYLLNYGLVCIAVMCSRKFAGLKTEMMFVVVFGWLVSNILIVLAANFHANAKKLQPLMWSIIAQLTLSQDNRVKHLRFLWLKQAQILDNQGGLALDAFGLRVTYVNIIQIIIWTVTIIVLALKS